MLPWSGDSERTFRSSSQVATCPPVYHTRWRFHTVPFNAQRQSGKLWIPIYTVFGLTRRVIEPVSNVSVADALSTRPLIGSLTNIKRHFRLLGTTIVLIMDLWLCTSSVQWHSLINISNIQFIFVHHC